MQKLNQKNKILSNLSTEPYEYRKEDQESDEEEKSHHLINQQLQNALNTDEQNIITLQYQLKEIKNPDFTNILSEINKIIPRMQEKEIQQQNSQILQNEHFSIYQLLDCYLIKIECQFFLQQYQEAEQLVDQQLIYFKKCQILHLFKGLLLERKYQNKHEKQIALPYFLKAMQKHSQQLQQFYQEEIIDYYLIIASLKAINLMYYKVQQDKLQFQLEKYKKLQENFENAERFFDYLDFQFLYFQRFRGNQEAFKRKILKKIEQNPQLACKGYSMIGLVLRLYGFYDQGLEFYKKSLQIDENYGPNRYQIALLYLYTGRQTKSNEEFVKCMEVDKHFPNAYQQYYLNIRHIESQNLQINLLLNGVQNCKFCEQLLFLCCQKLNQMGKENQSKELIEQFQQYEGNKYKTQGLQEKKRLLEQEGKIQDAINISSQIIMLNFNEIQLFKNKQITTIINRAFINEGQKLNKEQILIQIKCIKRSKLIGTFRKEILNEIAQNFIQQCQSDYLTNKLKENSDYIEYFKNNK